jgi:WD40 repeat protein
MNHTKHTQKTQALKLIPPYFTFKTKLLLRSHSAQLPISSSTLSTYNFNKKLVFSIHPSQPILVTIASDKLLSLYNIQTRKLLDRINLGVLPTCVKWNPDGSLLVVGFQNGTLKIFESKSIQGMQGRFGAKGERPGLELMLSISDSEAKTSVLSIEFSKKGDLMAVSYDN